MTAAAIAVESLSKSFGDERVLRDVDLSVGDGEFCVVVGPSGCGKSTLLDCISGVQSLDAGRVTLRGEDVSRTPVEHRNVGYVFQDFEETLFPHRTTEENVAFGLRHGEADLSAEEIDRRIDEALSLLAISETRHSPPGALSGGQQQRVELARQLVRECEVMLLDDPLSDLDYKLAKRMELEMRRLHRERGDTFLYVTHNQDQALKLADRLVVMNRGVVEQVGTPTEVYNRPANAFVARFVGDSNPLVGRVREHVDAETAHVETEAGELLAATGDEPIPTGVDSLLITRPERVSVGEAAEGRDNQFSATLEGSTYSGEVTEFAFSLGERPDDFLVVEPGKADAGAPGDEVPIGWDATDCRIFGSLSTTGEVDLEDLLSL